MRHCMNFYVVTHYSLQHPTVVCNKMQIDLKILDPASYLSWGRVYCWHIQIHTCVYRLRGGWFWCVVDNCGLWTASGLGGIPVANCFINLHVPGRGDHVEEWDEKAAVPLSLLRISLWLSLFALSDATETLYQTGICLPQEIPLYQKKKDELCWLLIGWHSKFLLECSICMPY